MNSIVIVGTSGKSTNMLYHALKDHFTITNIVLEQRISRVELVKKRLKKFSLTSVFGQLVFQIIYLPWLRNNSKHRLRIIEQENSLTDADIPQTLITWVTSANNEDCHRVISNLNPSAFLLSGTRILSSKTLSYCKSPVINIHAGITPFYRGVHGGYWALVNREFDKCGVTVHLVDKGIDTGNILAQLKIEITKDDNFTTYPIVQLAKGIELLKEYLPKYLTQSLTPKVIDAKGKLWYHPTLFEYLKNKKTKGVL